MDKIYLLNKSLIEKDLNNQKFFEEVHPYKYLLYTYFLLDNQPKSLYHAEIGHHYQIKDIVF